MITGPEGLPEQCQPAFTWMPVLAQGQCGTKQWLKAAVSDSVDLCPCLFTPRACHAPEPRGSNKALCPRCTCSTSWSFQGLWKLHVPSRAGLQHASIHTHWFLLQSTSVHVLLWYVFWFATKVGKHHTFVVICIWNNNCNIILQICTSSTEEVSQSPCWMHCTCFYLSICPASVSRKIHSVLYFSISN